MCEKPDDDEFDPTVPLADECPDSSADSSSDSEVEKVWHNEELEAYANAGLVAGKTKTAYSPHHQGRRQETLTSELTPYVAPGRRGQEADSDSVRNAKAFAVLVKKPSL